MSPHPAPSSRTARRSLRVQESGRRFASARGREPVHPGGRCLRAATMRS
ncbi:hypothetical protein ACFFX0_30540 [Citricoccus parietis]|uniref:Uncharacterized protein n=1 Tax=Citricoccus parietis TaxID=592307 RepID=A0ABV5G8L9_9MICC